MISSTDEAGTDTPGVWTAPRAPRDRRIAIAALIGAYMEQCAGRDPSRPQRLAWWAGTLGHVCLRDLTDDLVADAMEGLAARRGRYLAAAKPAKT